MERKIWNSFKWNLITYLSIILIIIGIGLLVFYYIESKVNECTRDPLKYTIEKIENMYPNEKVIFMVYVGGKQFSIEEGFINVREDISPSKINYSNFLKS